MLEVECARRAQDGRGIIQSGVLVRNVGWNAGAQVVPLLVAVFCVPRIAQELGADQFGILSLAWVTLTYLSLFDLGLGSATTKFVAEALGQGHVGVVPRLVWAALVPAVLFGLAGATMLALGTPILVDRVLHIPEALRRDAKLTFCTLAIALPLLTSTAPLRGALEGAQRFHVVSVIRLAANSLIFIAPVLALEFDCRLPHITACLVLVNLLCSGAYCLACIRVFPGAACARLPDKRLVVQFASFGGWMTIANVLAPVVVYGDRFLIGALLPVSAVGYYSTASEIATKMWLIPTSLLKTLFPAFSALTVAGSREVELLYERSLKFLLLTMAFPVAILMVLGSQILSVWLGGNFALHSGPLLRVLALGAFFNSLTAVPYALLQGAGRPDITAKLYLIQLPLYGCCCWALLRSFGMFGAALGWTLRMGAEACVFFLLCRRIFPGAAWLSRSTGVRAAGLVTGGVLIGALAVANLESKSTALQAGIAASLLGLEAILSWRYALQVEDRSAIRRILRMLMVGAGSDRRTSVSDQRAGAATLEGDRMASRAGGPRLANAPSADAVRDA